MGCVQSKAKKRIADIQTSLASNKRFEIKAKLKVKKLKNKKRNLFTIVEVASCNEESHDLSL